MPDVWGPRELRGRSVKVSIDAKGKHMYAYAGSGRDRKQIKLKVQAATRLQQVAELLKIDADELPSDLVAVITAHGSALDEPE